MAVVAPGTILGGKYRVDRVLGEGGMGMVVAATHVQLGTSFALKFILEEMVSNQALLDRFMREARAAAKLKGEHVCRVADVTMLEGKPCLVMEQLEGTDLGHLLKQHGRFQVQVAVDYVLQACAGMAEAHAVGIIHRDLKPSNLFLTHRMDGSPLIKILDFGVAKASHDESTELTQSKMILGSPSYMSLEQIRSSRSADARSDIWSFGIILYELVCGHRPFNGEGIADLALKIAMEPTPKLPFGPPALDVVIGKCLEKNPALRYQNVGELATALMPFASENGKSLAISVARSISRTSGATGAVPTPVPEMAPSHAQPTTLQSAAGAQTQPPTGRSAMWFALPVLALLIAGGLGFALSRRDSSSSTESGSVQVAPATPAAAPSTAAPPTSATVTPPPPTPVATTPPATTPPATPPSPPVTPAPTTAVPVDASVPVDAGVPADATPKKKMPKLKTSRPDDYGESRI